MRSVAELTNCPTPGSRIGKKPRSPDLDPGHVQLVPGHDHRLDLRDREAFANQLSDELGTETMRAQQIFAAAVKSEASEFHNHLTSLGSLCIGFIGFAGLTWP
jgi:hypothetical protein